jgi:hypothetical protein
MTDHYSNKIDHGFWEANLGLHGEFFLVNNESLRLRCARSERTSWFEPVISNGRPSGKCILIRGQWLEGAFLSILRGLACLCKGGSFGSKRGSEDGLNSLGTVPATHLEVVSSRLSVLTIE